MAPGDTIDLTGDSDDDTTPAASKTSHTQPRNTYPTFSQRLPQHFSPSPFIYSRPTIPPIPTGTGIERAPHLRTNPNPFKSYPTNSSTAPKPLPIKTQITDLAKAQEEKVDKFRSPVYATIDGEGSDNYSYVDRPEKRRKLSTNQDAAPGYNHSQTPARIPFGNESERNPLTWYGVRYGRVPGVYTEWSTVQNMTHGFPFSEHQIFKSKEEAQAYVATRVQPAPDSSAHATWRGISTGPIEQKSTIGANTVDISQGSSFPEPLQLSLFQKDQGLTNKDNSPRDFCRIPDPEPKISQISRNGEIQNGRSQGLAFMPGSYTPQFREPNMGYQRHDFQGGPEYGSPIANSVIHMDRLEWATVEGVSGPPEEATSNDTTQKTSRKRAANISFTKQEENLIIYLKENTQLRWTEIEKHFPGRKWTVLQSRYSTKLNKRDRSLDPPVWDLPEEFMAQLQAKPVSQPVLPSAQSPARRRGRPPRFQVISQDNQTRDTSSGGESGTTRGQGRPRRNVQTIDYTWPRHAQNSRLEVDDEDDIMIDMYTSRVSEPSEEPSLTPETALPVDQPMDIDFDQENAILVHSGALLPYLSQPQRAVIQQESSDAEWDQLEGRKWQGSVVHVDFSKEETAIAERVINNIAKVPMAHVNSGRKRLHKLLSNLPEAQIFRAVSILRKKLEGRDQESIRAFLADAKNRQLRAQPRVDRLGSVRANRVFSSYPKATTSTLIRQRETGMQSRRGWKAAFTGLTYQMKNKVYDSLGPSYNFTGASSDVHTLAWSPDGQRFAAGAVCVTDPSSRQYNRPDNLLYGDLTCKSIYELGEHYIERQKADSGPNSTDEMHITQDPRLFTTVSSVAFSPQGDYMISAGYDCHASVWRIGSSGTQPELLQSLRHKAEIDLMTVSPCGLFATAAKRHQKAIKVLQMDSKGQCRLNNYNSRKADSRPDQNILPTALKFEPQFGHLLLAGFGANKREDRMDTSGDICLWDVETQQELQIHGSARCVFDVAFHPLDPGAFIVGSVAGQNVNRGTRSTIRWYKGQEWDKRTSLLELECPALDMNEVAFCPYDDHLVAAGCTSGRTYIWDVRRPDGYLYRLSHSDSLMPLNDDEDREIADTGVRFLSWGENTTRLYTGSSDGVVKVWDVTRAQGDVYIKDLIKCDSGVMSGAFSPDYDKLLIGEVDGSLNVLEVGKDDYAIKDMEKLKHIDYAPIEDDEDDADDPAFPPTAPDSGRTIAKDLLDTGQMMYTSLNGLPIRQAVQGPNYDGPFDRSMDAHFLRAQALRFQYNLTGPTGPQCEIPSCKDGIIITSEEVGDSGRSTDRIPDELRKQWQTLHSDLELIPGKSRCANCGRPARPSTSSTSTDAVDTLCERCSFTCFRCGATNRVKPATEKLVCHTCFRVWSIGALGYECVEETGCRVNTTNVPGLEGYGRELVKEANVAATNQGATLGDEMNALTDYYLSLAIDRPESPPL